MADTHPPYVDAVPHPRRESEPHTQRLTHLLAPEEIVQAVAIGNCDAVGGPSLVAVTDRRILGVGENGDTVRVDLAEVGSILTAGNPETGSAVTIQTEGPALRITGVPFGQAQEFAAAIRSVIARTPATWPG